MYVCVLVKRFNINMITVAANGSYALMTIAKGANSIDTIDHAADHFIIISNIRVYE